MIWSDFYDNYIEWAESTLRSRISSLEDIGSGEEVAEVVMDLPSDKLKAQLIRKAMRHKVQFTHDDFMNLDGELTDELYRELATYTGFDANNPYFDENNMTWDDFSSEYYEWSEKDTLRRIQKLNDFGPAAEVSDVVCAMPNWDCQNALYQKAVTAGIKFTRNQLEDMGQNPEDGEDCFDLGSDSSFTEEDMANFEANIEILCNNLEQLYPTTPVKPKRKKLGFLGTLLVILGAFAGAGSGKKKKDTGHCDGDCANCPAHYGYRYGRWYYGHGHRYGCQRGGNGGL